MSKKRVNLADFGGQNFAKFRTHNFAKLILQSQLLLSRNSRKFCNTTHHCVEIYRCPANRILREIKFGNFWVWKTAIFNFLALQNFGKFGKFNTFKCGIFSQIKVQGLQNGQNHGLWAPKIAKFDFRYNLNGSKIPKFPHCGALYFYSNRVN